jgi:hypothetical protein
MNGAKTGLLVVTLAVLGAPLTCARRPMASGPSPEYERPVVEPWDAGADQAPDEFDPFAAAAESDWVGGEEETLPSEGGSGGEGGVSANGGAGRAGGSS